MRERERERERDLHPLTLIISIRIFLDGSYPHKGQAKHSKLVGGEVAIEERHTNAKHIEHIKVAGWLVGFLEY